MGEEKGALAQKLIEIVNEISGISEFRISVKKEYCNLGRRLKLLIPMFEEIRDNDVAVSEDSMKALFSLKEALESTKELLKFGSDGSKIYLVRVPRIIFYLFSVLSVYLRNFTSFMLPLYRGFIILSSTSWN